MAIGRYIMLSDLAQQYALTRYILLRPSWTVLRPFVLCPDLDSDPSDRAIGYWRTDINTNPMRIFPGENKAPA